MPLIETADCSLFYRDWGAGDPVVFCAAWALSSVAWQYQMISVVDSGRRAVAYDRRGHGRSDDPGRGYGYDTLADDLARLLEHLDLRDVTLIAHSMGSGEAVRYLTRHGGGRAARLMLLAPTTPFVLKTPANEEGIDGELLAQNREAWRRDFGRWIVENEGPYFGDGLPGCDVSSLLRDWTKADMLDTTLQAAIEFQRSAVETDFRAELSTLSAPTLIVHGDADASAPLPLTGARTAELLPNCRMLVYEMRRTASISPTARRSTQISSPSSTTAPWCRRYEHTALVPCYGSQGPERRGRQSSCSAAWPAASASPRELARPCRVPAGPNADQRKPPSGSSSTAYPEALPGGSSWVDISVKLPSGLPATAGRRPRSPQASPRASLLARGRDRRISCRGLSSRRDRSSTRWRVRVRAGRWCSPTAIRWAHRCGLPRFTRPTLIAWSADDAFFPLSDGQRLADVLPDSRLEVIQQSRTFSMIDQPDRLAELIAPFARPSTAAAAA